MSYRREIPRDLFNEAALLKCYGQLFLQLERRVKAFGETIILKLNAGPRGDKPFEVEQDPSHGGIYLANVTLWIHGVRATLHRPLNATGPYPLYLTTADQTEISVFDDAGDLTEDMLALVGSPWLIA